MIKNLMVNDTLILISWLKHVKNLEPVKFNGQGSDWIASLLFQITTCLNLIVITSYNEIYWIREE